MPVTLPILLIYILAAARITRIIVDDDIFNRQRDALLGWLDPAEYSLGWYVANLITGQWCIGFWVCAGVTSAMWWHGNSPYVLIPAVALAMSQAVGAIYTIGR